MKQLVITLQENEDGSVTGGIHLPSPAADILARNAEGESTLIDRATLQLVGLMLEEGMIEVDGFNREEAESAGPSTDSPISLPERCAPILRDLGVPEKFLGEGA